MKKGRILTMLILTGAMILAGCGLTREEVSLYADEEEGMQAALAPGASTEGTFAPSGEGGEESGASKEGFFGAQDLNPGFSADEIAYWEAKTRQAVNEHAGEDQGTENARGAEGSGDASGEDANASGGENANAKEPQNTPAPVETKAPVETPSPRETAAPKEGTAQTIVPASTGAPEQTPAPTRTPDETPAPTKTPAQDGGAQNTPAPGEGGAPAEKTPAQVCAEQGHVFTVESSYVFYDSTCSVTGDRCYVCERCGKEDHGIIPKKEHEFEVVVINEGNCIDPYTYERTCKICGYHEPTQYDYGQCENRHEWYTGTYQKFNQVTLEWEDVEVTRCARCGIDKPQ